MENDDKILKEFIDPPLGDMQLFVQNKWKSFHIGDVFENINHLGLLPKARCWNGKEWKRIGIRNHILGIIGLINEDME